MKANQLHSTDGRRGRGSYEVDLAHFHWSTGQCGQALGRTNMPLTAQKHLFGFPRMS